jgi:hypothetical protein
MLTFGLLAGTYPVPKTLMESGCNRIKWHKRGTQKSNDT